MTIIVTVEQMCEFIMQQPPERKINFAETSKKSDCGCLMVHYGIANGFEFNNCGIDYWSNDRGLAATLQGPNGNSAFYYLFIPGVTPEGVCDTTGDWDAGVWNTTYGEVQKLVPAILAGERENNDGT